MLFDFFKETISLYSEELEYFPVFITQVRDVFETSKDQEKNKGKPDYYLVGTRVDKPQIVLTVIHPFKDVVPVEVGDYVLAKRVTEGIAIFVAKINKNLPFNETEYFEGFFSKPILPQFADKKAYGNFYNASTIYSTYTNAYQKKEENYLYKRFVELPSYELYKSYYDIFNYEQKFWDILQDKNEEKRSREFIFKVADNPLDKDYIYSRNSDEGFPYRPDLVFDFWHSKSSKNTNEKLLKLNQKVSLFENNLPTDKYPYLQALESVSEEFRYTSYDEIVNENASYLDKDIFYAQEMKEIKLGRNKIGIYKINKRDNFFLAKTSNDQQISALSVSPVHQIRIRNTDGTLLFMEQTSNHHRTLLATYPSILFEQFFEENYQHLLLLNSEKEKFKRLQDSQTPTNDYSFVFLFRGNKNSQLKRTDLHYEGNLSDSQNAILGTRIEDSKGFFTLSSSPSGSQLTSKVEKTYYVEITASSESGCFKVENNLSGVKYFELCGDTFEINEKLKVLGSANILRDLNVYSGKLVVDSSGISINGSTTITGNVTITGIVTINGTLTVTGAVHARAFVITP